MERERNTERKARNENAMQVNYLEELCCIGTLLGVLLKAQPYEVVVLFRVFLGVTNRWYTLRC